MPLFQGHFPYQSRGVFDPQPGGGGDSVATTNFLARVVSAGVTLDGTHTSAYKALLNGLTTDGLFNSDGTSNFFDILYIYATNDSGGGTTTALLNLANSTFSGTNTGGLSFTADLGFTGTGTLNTFINTGFNPVTATTPNYTQNAAHISMWNLTNSVEGSQTYGGSNASTAGADIYAKFSDNSIYFRVQDTSSGFIIADPRGHLLGNRSSSTARQGYQNASTTLDGGVSVSYGSTASSSTVSLNLVVLGEISSASVRQAAMVSAGGSMNSTQVSNFYTRLRTYMTTVGVP